MAAAEATTPSLTSSQVAPEQYVLAGDTKPLNAEAAAIWEQALAKASRYLTNLLSDPNREALFAVVFGRAGTDPATFAANLQVLLAALGGDGLQIAVDLRSDDELGGAFAAYAASGHTGSERIYMNADKLNNGLLDVTLATSALLEEFGHALDWRLNGAADSPGDEGQLFAAEVSGMVLTTEQRALIDAEDDTAVLMIDGVEVLVEQFSVTNSWTGANSSALNNASNYATGASVDNDGNPSALFVFGRLTPTNTAPTATSEFKANQILFEGATSFTLTNNSSFFNFVKASEVIPGITQSSSAAQTLAGGIRVSDGPLTLGGDGVGLVTLSGTSNNDYASKGLSKTGSSSFLLSSGIALNTGTVTISGGTLALSSTTSLSGQIQLRGGVLATSGTFSRVLGTGTANVNFGAGGGGFAAYGGALTVSTALGGWASTTNGLAVSTPLILGSSIADNVVTLTSTLGLGTAAREIRLVDNPNSANDRAVMSGVISGSGGGLTVTGSGTLTLSGVNTYTGVTTLSGGVLSVATIGNGGAAGNLGQADQAASRLVFDGGTLRYTGATASTNRGFTLNAGKTGTIDVTTNTLTISGASTATTGALTKAGAGTLVLSGANLHTGATTISAGALNLRNATGLGTTAAGTTVASGAALQIQGDITVGAEALTLSGTGQTSTGALLNVSGNNTYGGAITRAAATTIGSTTGTLTLSGAMTGNFATTFTGAGNITGSGVISGTGAVTKSGAGTLLLTGSNTYTGGTTLSAGTLDVSGAAGALTATSAVNISGGTLLLSGSAADRISNGASIFLGGATDTKIQLSGAVTETLGSLTLSSGSGFRVIDFGSTSGVLTLASLTAEIALDLQIWNWSGTTGSGGGTDQLIISSGSLGGELSTSNIKFYSDSGTTLLSSAGMFTGTSELVADTTPPAAPFISTVTDDVSPVTGTVASGGTTNDTDLVLAGTAEANSSVTVRNGGTSLGTVTADGSGAWTFTTATLADGSYTFNATATDGAGNVSAASANYIVTVDTAISAGSLSLANYTDSGTSSSDFISTDKSFDLSLSGTESGASVVYQLSTNGGSSWSTTTSTQSNLTDGAYQLRAAVTDAAGNTANTNTLSLTVDATAPTSNVGSQSAPLVEAGGASNATAGTAAATITVTKADALSSASFDSADLTSNGWSSADAGATYTKAGSYGTATFTIASGVVSYSLNNSAAATQALTQGQAAADGFGTLRIVDAAGNSSQTAEISFAITGANDFPVFSVLTPPVETTGRNSQTEISFAELLAQANATDGDGSVVAFQVAAVASGSLLIGSSAGTATAWAAGSNDSVNAGTNLYWTPAADQAGTLANPLAIGAFSVYAVDNNGGLSDSPVTATVNVVCFLAGTLIATPSGERPIETLQPGDLISTAEGPQPVRFISRTSHFPWVLEANDVLPIRIAAGALGERGPVRDLYVSPDHAILVDGHLLHASVLVNGTTITRTSLAHWQQRINQPIEYLNIELERHQLITAEGLVVESFVDNRPRSDWDNYTAYLSLYHQELPIRELLLPRVKFKRQLSSALRRLLQQLADGGVQHRQLVAAG
jgi:autotransporter-associated beta strand protein/VCBS repeat-containing protein